MSQLTLESLESPEIRLGGQPALVVAEFVLSPRFAPEVRRILVDRGLTLSDIASPATNATAFLQIHQLYEKWRRSVPWIAAIALIVLIAAIVMLMMAIASHHRFTLFVVSIVSALLAMVAIIFSLKRVARLESLVDEAEEDLKDASMQYLFDLEYLLDLPISSILAMSYLERRERADTLLIALARKKLIEQRKLHMLNRDDPYIIRGAATLVCNMDREFNLLFNELKKFQLTDNTNSRYYEVARKHLD